MDILYTNDKKRFLAYHTSKTIKREDPYIIFHHGLMSNMEGKKALWVEEFCNRNSYNYIRFDNFGHGKSSGKFEDQTITDWLEGLNLVIDSLAIDKEIILVGSSMGAWISMLAAMNKAKKIKALICISAAIDFTENLIWDKLSDKEKRLIEIDGSLPVTGSNTDCNHSYPISFNLIQDGRKHLLLNQDIIDIDCPVHLIHGQQDVDVPVTLSQEAYVKISHDEVVLKIIKDGHHNLSREKDLAIIGNSISEILL